MNRLITFGCMIIFICICGCAKKVDKYWAATGGSRADAVVEVGFVYNPQNEIPVPNAAQAQSEATSKCVNWGYTEAEPFGMVEQRCQQSFFNPYLGPQCVSMLVVRKFQCLGRGDSATPLDQTSPVNKPIGKPVKK